MPPHDSHLGICVAFLPTELKHDMGAVLTALCLWESPIRALGESQLCRTTDDDRSFVAPQKAFVTAIQTSQDTATRHSRDRAHLLEEPQVMQRPKAP